MADSRKTSGLVIVALVVGIAGAGLGGFSIFLHLTPETTEEYPLYYCDSEAEINTALSDIGTGAGTIVITRNITLAATILIAAGGSYVIQGIAPDIALDCNGDRSAINITSVLTCTVRDLTVDASDITTTNRVVIGALDTSLYFENLRIITNGLDDGYGIYINSSEVWVTNCYVRDVRIGIFVDGGASSVHISDNTIINCGQSDGIYLDGNGITCANNLIRSCLYGITTYANKSLIANNYIELGRHGIHCYGSNSSFTGNVIIGRRLTTIGNVYGFYIADGASYNVFTGNTANSLINTSGDLGYGFMIAAATVEETTVVGNTFLGNEVNFSDLGTNTIDFGNNYV